MGVDDRRIRRRCRQTHVKGLGAIEGLEVRGHLIEHDVSGLIQLQRRPG